MSTFRAVIGSIILMAFIFLGAFVMGMLHYFFIRLEPGLTLIMLFIIGIVTIFIVMKTWK